jgi:hypothetical protein
MSLDFGDYLPNPRVDFTNVAVRYDAAAGRVDVAFTFSAVPPASYEIRAGVGLGSIDANKNCTAPVYTSNVFHEDASLTGGGVAIVGHYDLGYPGVGGRLWSSYSDPDSAIGWFDADSSIYDWQSGPNKEWNFGTVNAALSGRNYTCAYAAMWANGTGGQGNDYSDVFPLSAVVDPRPPTNPAPVLPPPAAVEQSGVLGANASARVGVREARRAVKRVLTKHYRKHFTHGKRYRITCRGAVAKTCQVRWQYRRTRYKGKVKLTRATGRLVVKYDITRLP